MKNRKVRLLFLIIISLSMAGCRKIYNEDYTKRFDKYFEYSLGEYTANVFDKNLVANEFSIGFDSIPISFDVFKVCSLAFQDKDGNNRTLVFTNYADDHKENLTSAVLTEAKRIVTDTIDKEVIKSNFPDINIENEENFLFYNTKLIAPENSKLISPKKVLNKKKGLNLSEFEPKTLVEQFGYEYSFELLYMGLDETEVQKTKEEYKLMIKKLSDYLNQDIITFKFYKAFDRKQCFKGVYDRQRDTFDITEITQSEYDEMNSSSFEIAQSYYTYKNEDLTSSFDISIYNGVSPIIYIERLIKETIKETNLPINPKNVEVLFNDITQELIVKYDLTTKDIRYYTKKAGIEFGDIGEYYKTLMENVVSKIDYENILIEYKNKYDLRYGYEGRYNSSTQKLDYSKTYTEKEDRFTTDGYLKMFCIGEPVEVIINGEFTFNKFSGEIIYYEEKQGYYPTPKFIEKLLKNTIGENNDNELVWLYNSKDYRLVRNRADDKYELYENNILVLEYGDGINDTLSVSYLENITGIEIVLNNDTEGIELYFKDANNEDDFYIMVEEDEIIDAEYIKNIEEYYLRDIYNYDDDEEYHLKYSSQNNNYSLYKNNTKVFEFISDANDEVNSLGEVTGMNVILIDNVDDCIVNLYSRVDEVINSSVYIDNQYIVDTTKIRDSAWLKEMGIGHQVVSSNFFLLEELKNLSSLGAFMDENDLVIEPGVYKLNKNYTLEELIVTLNLGNNYEEN